MALHAIDHNNIPYMVEGITTVEEQLNGDDSLTIELTDSPINKDVIKNITESWKFSGVEGNNDRTVYVVKRKAVSTIGKFKKLVINAIPLFNEVFNTTRLYNYYEGEFTADAVLSSLFNGSGFTYQLPPTFTSSKYIESYGDGQTKLEIFNNVLETFELEFKVNGNTVELSKYLVNRPDYIISDTINAANVQQEIDGFNFYTYAKGYADVTDGDPNSLAGISREYTHPLASVPGVGKKHAPPLRLSEETDPAKLEAALKTYVDNSLKVSITSDFISLRKQYPEAVPKKADEVMFVANNISYKQMVRIVGITTKRNHMGDIITQSVTYGDQPLAKRHKANVNFATQFINELVKGRRTISSTMLDSAISTATSLILNAKTQLDFTSSLGIVAKNPDNPQEMVVFNSAGLGISKNGGKTFRNAITGAGMVADVITSGTLNTQLVKIEGTTGAFVITGDTLTSVDVKNPDKKTVISAGNVSVWGGGFSAYRPSGVPWTVNGVPKNELVVQRIWFTSPGVSHTGQMFQSANTTPSSFEAAYFNHNGSKLTFTMAYTLAPNSASSSVYGFIRVREFGATGTPKEWMAQVLVKRGSIDYISESVDIGEPGYEERSFYLEFWIDPASAPSNTMAVRCNKIAQRG
ncbi:phage tail protein [Macrococcus bovicus]|uniref:Uncharacterized protein n=1 Tax=Macrococcus bovicus TaxID=69968 RepID=A0A4V6PPT4_9STAP|nr:phage tail protein [Macrococcus bovicus]TDM12650.1 hypothetical protein ERX55_10355 [Macrococcus bovicus]